ncbi:hypothetical protein GLP26_19305 [Photobacterium carnosum]|uniref:hypothetical protein n=1 Tax=Photobacterium carnosum TaxID=2023717 RepID=UPI001F402DDC|nr:hypothetical protein [Photobacterium carnosum]MCF2163667.1 hypothetical protein [Photobacterium carnosum]MCF2307911.1 hypothetical protein [Photobacterium carnosum]
MNYCQQKRINSAVRFSEKKQQAMYNFISLILNNTILETESVTTLQKNIKYSYKDGSFTKIRVKNRNYPHFGFEH